MKKVLFVIGLRSFVLNYIYMIVVVSNCLSKFINYIWFVNIMHFFSKIVVLFYCFEEMCISNILLDAPSGLRKEAKSFFPP